MYLLIVYIFLIIFGFYLYFQNNTHALNLITYFLIDSSRHTVTA